jgi:D-alanyl-D-alanine carboxypeptidase/D-alanyl-D-alanine-endopeptidase (penicillin-binding protein 4)
MYRSVRSIAVVAALFGLAGSAIPAASQTSSTAVPANVQSVFDKPLYKGATWGMRVLDGDKVLIDLNSDRQLYIGSVRKVFSVGQLLNAVGPDHTYDTPVYRTGSVDANGVLHGNLIVVASGDLTMGGRKNPDGTIAVSDWDHNEADSLGNAILTKPNPLAGYAQLAQAVRAAGIKRVTGDVVIDDRLFKPYFFRDQFSIRPIFVNDDVVDLSMTPGGTPGSPVRFSYRPMSAALRVVSRLVVAPPNAKTTFDMNPRPECIGAPGCTVTITGSLDSNYVPPLTGEPVLVQTVRITQPSNYARTVFVEQLRSAGVTVAAPPVQQNMRSLLPAWGSYAAANRVALLTGMRYAQDAKFILKISYNIGADTSLILLGTKNGANSMPAALAYARKDLATRWGIPANEYHFIDGSGYADTTATNGAVTKMLTELATSPAAKAFMDALPILGVDGSLGFVKDFEKDPTLAGAAGNVRAKTGTYVEPTAENGVMDVKGQAYGGYVTTKSGHHLTFMLTVNGVKVKDVLSITNVFQDEGTIAAMLWRDY